MGFTVKQVLDLYTVAIGLHRAIWTPLKTIVFVIFLVLPQIFEGRITKLALLPSCANFACRSSHPDRTSCRSGNCIMRSELGIRRSVNIGVDRMIDGLVINHPRAKGTPLMSSTGLLAEVGDGVGRFLGLGGLRVGLVRIAPMMSDAASRDAEILLLQRRQSVNNDT